MSFNKVIIVGNLGRDPETRVTPQGTNVCNFSLATSEKSKDEEITTWFRVTVWGKQAEHCQQYLAKGKQVYVEGRLRLTEYTDKDGNKRNTLEVNASDVKFLGSKESGGQAQAAGASATPAARQQASVASTVDDDLDNIPF